MMTSLRPIQWHPIKTMSPLHMTLYVPLKEAAKRTVGTFVRFLPGVDAHVPSEVIPPTAGPATNWTTQLSNFLTPRFRQRTTQWLTHQHLPCFFQLQRNSIHQLWMYEAVSHHSNLYWYHLQILALLAPWYFFWSKKTVTSMVTKFMQNAFNHQNSFMKQINLQQYFFS